VGLDVGTTGTKAVAFDLASSWRRVVVGEYPLLEPVAGWQVQDPDVMVAVAADAVRECVAATDGAEVLAVSLCTAMHGLIALDGSGRALTPLVTWADSRSSEEARSLRASGQARDLHRVTGTPVHPMSPLTKLMWFRSHEPQTWARARWWVGLKDYLLLRLTGTVVTELSSASATGMLDMFTRTWSPAAIELSGVSVDQLPPVVSTTSVLELSRAAAGRFGLPAGTPVVTGAADGPLGNLGTGAIAPGVASVSLGTSGAVRMVIPTPRVDEKGALFCYALTEEAWVLGGAVSNGGVVIRWAGQSLAPELRPGAGGSVDEQLLALAAQVPAGCDGLVMLPHLLAERAPLWDPELPGAYLGLRRVHTRGHLVRATVEGVCRQLGTIVDSLDRLSAITSVRVTGGAFRSALWRDVLAATLNRPLQVVGATEGSALGAAALALLALGRATDLEEAVAQFAPPGGTGFSQVEPVAEQVAAYARISSTVPDLIRSLAAVVPLFERTETGAP
jgi:gluconokinase